MWGEDRTVFTNLLLWKTLFLAEIQYTIVRRGLTIANRIIWWNFIDHLWNLKGQMQWELDCKEKLREKCKFWDPIWMIEKCVRVCLCRPFFLIVDPGPHFSIIVGMLSTELVWCWLFVASIPTTWPHNASHNAFLISEYFKYLIKAWKYIFWQSVLKYHRSFQFWVLRFFLSAYFRWGETLITDFLWW